MIQLLVATSLALQLLNIWLLLRLVKITGVRLAWLFLGSAMIVTAIYRLITLCDVWWMVAPTADMLDQAVATVSSSAMASLGLFLIRPVFDSLRQAEIVSRQSEEQYRTLFEHSPLPIVICDTGKIQYANRAALSILGTTSLGEIIKRPFADFCESADRRKVDQIFAALSENAQPEPIAELTLIRTDCRPIEVEVGIALFLYGGALAQYVVMWDVSNRKRKEEQLRARETELALVNRRQTMGEIAAELAHEVNQPLYAVCNFAEAALLQLDSRDPAKLPEVRNCLEQVHGQATRAAQIVKNLRNFVGSREEKVAVYSLNRMVRDAFELVAIEARRQRTVVEFQLSPDEPQVRVDRVQLEQVIVNLLMNAFEALAGMPVERNVVRVTTAIQADQAVLMVADLGPGIKSEIRNRVFEPFYSTKSSGMGMGLAICRTIVLQYEGKIEAIPNEPHGATFQVTLPIAEGPLQGNTDA
jgi:PAS domain S-box-containing protein